MYSSSLDSDSSTSLRSDSPESTRSYKEKTISVKGMITRIPTLSLVSSTTLYLTGAWKRKLTRGRKETRHTFILDLGKASLESWTEQSGNWGTVWPSELMVEDTRDTGSTW